MRPLILTLAMISLVGCALERAPIFARADGGASTMDAGMTPDVPLPPGVDAPVMETDTPTGCASSCSVGQRCESGACVCAADLCAGTRTCVTNECLACGGAGELCCPATPCRDGRSCGGDGRCPSSRCSMVGDPCCGGDRCDGGLRCVGGSCVRPCGGEREPCCATGEECGMWLSCQIASLDLSRACLSCGAWGEPCCAGGRCEGSMGCESFSSRCF